MLLGVIFVVLLIILGVCFLSNKKHVLKKTYGVDVVPTMYDFVFSDSSWCATFQLIWNDLKNSVVFQDIKFIDDNSYVSNLNKESFTTDDISDSFYYKIYGKKSLELKDEIVRGIKEKFNQSSDIIDKFDFVMISLMMVNLMLRGISFIRCYIGSLSILISLMLVWG